MGSQDPDFQGRVTLLKNTLTTANDLYVGFKSMQQAQSSSTDKKVALDSELTSLKSQLASIRKSAETYDREFLDRKQAGEGVATRWRRWGISTVQDWSLAAFFASYALACLTAILYAVMYAPEKKMAIGTIILAAVVLGIFIATMLLRMG
jgi:hypothetical protein